MAFAAIQNHNPFLLPGLLFLAIWLARKQLLRRNLYITRIKHGWRSYLTWFLINPVVSQVLLGLTALSATLYFVFEYYYASGQCFVSQRYYSENLMLIQKVLAVFAAANQPYWLDYATLLSQLRGQAINVWDHDVDISTVYPGSWKTLTKTSDDRQYNEQWEHLVNTPKGAQGKETLDELLQVLKDADLHYIWEEKRHLIQVYHGKHTRGPHVDIWLWSAETHPTDSRFVLLDTGDKAVVYRPRPLDQIFPVKHEAWKDVHAEAAIPNSAHVISEQEFGVYGGDYMVAQVFRGDCFHNFFNARWMY